MARITLEQIKETLSSDNWVVLSESYTNLDSEMHFRCPEGHDVYSPWKKLRTKLECPICKKNTLLAPDRKVEPKHKGMLRTLALDQATHTTGYAIFDGTTLVTSGTFETTKTNEVERLAAIKNWVVCMIENWQPDVIGLEGIQYQDASSGRKMGVTVFETLARLQGILMLVCFENDIKCEICPTNTWRHACGVKGVTRTDRKRSMQLLVKQWYDATVSDDVADAIGIGHYLCNKIDRSMAIKTWEIE